MAKLILRNAEMCRILVITRPTLKKWTEMGILTMRKKPGKLPKWYLNVQILTGNRFTFELNGRKNASKK
jgi:predicted site-specific integrase-resolvase